MSIAAPPPVDSDIRIKAISTDTSFAVSAPAGSGKTGLLTQRFLALLALCRNPEEVLAITFTRKAAGEMQDRIMHALWQANELPEPDDVHAKNTWALAKAVLKHDQELGWSLLETPQRLRIKTIDSLCRDITRQLPLSSGLGAQPDTLDNPEVAYRLAVRELFNLLDSETSTVRDDIALLLSQMDNNLPAVENLLVGLLAKREQWLDILLAAKHGGDVRPYFEAVVIELIEEHLAQLNAELMIHTAGICQVADGAASNLPAGGEGKNTIHELVGMSGLPSVSHESLKMWSALADLFLTNGGTFRARLTKNEGFPAGKEGAYLKEQFTAVVEAMAERTPGIEQLIDGVRLLPSPNYDEDQWVLLKALTDVLPVLAAQLTLVFKQQSGTDYTAISQAAINALGDEDSPTDIAMQLDYRISHILIDEFQDTAGPQLELLKRLTGGWQQDDGRTLFIVGDGMQSCYGFRNANVGIFLDARLNGIGDVNLTPLDLKVNFRSQEGVIDWVNTTFKNAFPSSDDIGRGAVSYSPSSAFKPALDGKAVEFHVCPVEQNEQESDDEDSPFTSAHQAHEAELVVSLVNKAKQEDPDGTIAILVRTRSHLQQILPALTSAGLTYQATEIDALSTRMAILDIMSLTKALLNPADRIAWLSVLRAPWCGLDSNDLHALITTERGAANPTLTENGLPAIFGQLLQYREVAGLTTAGIGILHRVVPILQKAYDERSRKTLRQWVHGTWIALGGPATLLNSNDAINIDSYLDLLDKHQQGGYILDGAAFDQAVGRLYAAPQANGDPKLQVMTIHKSKGLEFDTVIIPGLDRRSRKDDKQLLLWKDRINSRGEQRLLLSAMSPTGKDDSELYSFMRSEADKQASFEATRLLYVGCTRAIKKLHLTACLKRKEDEFSSPAKNSLLYCIWPFIKQDASAYVPVGVGSQFRINPDAYNHITRLPASWSMPELEKVELLADYRGRELEIIDPLNPLNIPTIETPYARLSRHCGILIHEALQSLSSQVIESRSIGDWVNRFKGGWNAQLAQWGWTGEMLDRALLKAEQALVRTLTSPEGIWMLRHDHIDASSELSLIQADDGDFRESIIDRTFVEDGIRWIIDYKSSEPGMDEQIDDFYVREMHLHAPQLNRYQDIMQSMGETNIRKAIFFTNTGTLKSY